MLILHWIILFDEAVLCFVTRTAILRVVLSIRSRSEYCLPIPRGDHLLGPSLRFPHVNENAVMAYFEPHSGYTLTERKS